MKPAEEYIKDFWGTIDNGCDSRSRNISGWDVASVIKYAQFEAIKDFNEWLDENHSSFKIPDMILQEYLK